MANRKLYQPVDSNGKPLGLIQLNDSQYVDGTSATAKSAAIEGYAIRIKSMDNDLKFKIGPDSIAEPLEAAATDIALSALDEIYQPIQPGEKVAILGGIANICTCGV